MKYIKSFLGIIKQLKSILNKKQIIISSLFIVVIIIGSCFETLGVSAVLPFIEAITSPDELLNKNYVKFILSIFHFSEYNQIVIFLAISIVLVYLIKNLYLYFSIITQTSFRSKIQKSLSVSMFQSYLYQSYEDYLELNTAKMIRGINEDVTGVYNIMDNIFKILGELFTISLISAYLIYTDFVMAIGIIVVAFLCVIIIILGMKKKMSILGISSREIRTRRNNSAYQAITGFKEIKVANKIEKFSKRYSEEYEKQRRIEMQNEAILNIPEKLIEFLCVSVLILTICIKIAAGVDITTFVSSLAVFAIAAFRMMPSVSRISRYFNSIIYSRPSLNAICERIQTVGKSQNYCIEEKNLEKISFQNDIHICNVSWNYRSSSKIILDSVDFNIRKGQSVALVGSSGAGKSTLVDIILGVLIPKEGDIFVDGKSIYSNLTGWCNLIGYVPQNIYMMDDSLRNNIVFGEDEIDEKKIWDILEKVKLADFVKDLPKQLDTQVGERGLKISGGQKQRLALARALYRNPEILILDEATSALDNETEKAIMESITELQGEKTMIIIAHRITTIKDCDVIYEVNNGKIVERKYEEL